MVISDAISAKARISIFYLKMSVAKVTNITHAAHASNDVNLVVPLMVLLPLCFARILNCIEKGQVLNARQC
jgi:hypothetical protein